MARARAGQIAGLRAVDLLPLLREPARTGPSCSVANTVCGYLLVMGHVENSYLSALHRNVEIKCVKWLRKQPSPIGRGGRVLALPRRRHRERAIKAPFPIFRR